MTDIPITPGSGGASVATETVSNRNFQLVEIYGAGGASVLGINPDNSINASIIGIPTVTTGNASIIAVIQGSVATSITPAANQSVSGTVGASVVGHAPVVIVGGSILTSATANQSVSGTVGASIVGLAPVNQLNANYTAATDNLSPGNSLQAIAMGHVFNGSNWDRLRGNSSVGALVNTGTGSVIVLVQGSVATVGTTANQSVSGALNVSGSVLLGNSTASVITVWKSSSIIAVNAGSVVTISQGSVINVLQAPSIVGTYAEDAAHATGDKGMFVMQVRNDTMSSVTSADGDYSPIAGGPVGETIVANAPITKWVRGTADLRGAGSSGVSVIALSAAGSSIFTYVTGVQVANMGSASVLVTLASGGSILGYTIAPAGGGSNIVYPNALKTPANFGFAASISGAASVLVSAQGFTSKT